MRKIRRDENNVQYYDQYWKEVASEDDHFTNLDIYPIKYSEEALEASSRSGLILECGCGLGRVVKHYHKAGRKIIGLEYNEFALLEIRKTNPDIPLIRADLRALPFKDGSFEVFMAYGLFHNIENNLTMAFEEASRTIKVSGVICASSRIQNIQGLLHDIKYKVRNGFPKSPVFYKWMFKKKEWINFFVKQNFSILSVHPAYHTPPLYRISLFRDKRCNEMTQSQLRTYGCRLNALGSFVERCFHRFYDYLICDRIVVIAKKKE